MEFLKKGLVASLLAGLFSQPVFASHHGWAPVEAFSNADGTLQFVEMLTSGNGESQLAAAKLDATDLATNQFNQFTFTNLSTSTTAGRRLLIATAGFEAAYGITPDFVFEDNFLTTTAGDVWYNTALTWSSGLPTDGWQSYNTGGLVQAATPTNFAGDTVTLVEPAPEPEFTLVRQYLMTNSASNNVTTLHIVNDADEEQSFTGTLYVNTGEQQGSADVDLSPSAIPAKGRLTLGADDLERLFGVGAWKGPAMLEVKGSGSFSLMSKLVSPSGLISNTNCVLEEKVLNIEDPFLEELTYIRFINTGEEAMVDIRGTLYDSSGVVIGTSDTQLFESLPAKSQDWLNRTDFLDLFGSWSGVAMLEVNSPVSGVDNLKLLNLNFVNEETFFNFSCFESSASSGDVYLMTTSTSNNISNLHIINTSDAAQGFSGTLFNKEGTQLGGGSATLAASVPAKGRVILTADDLEEAFDIEPWQGPALMQVAGDDEFELMIKLQSPSQLISNTNCVRRNEVHNIEGFDSPDQTYVRFINIGNSDIGPITGTMYQANGELIGDEDVLLIENLGSKSAVWQNRGHLSDKFGTWNGEAYLKVSEHDNLRLLNLNYINNETFFNFSCYEESE